MVVAALIVGGLAAVTASAMAPQNSGSYNEVGGLPVITGTSSTTTCPSCGVDKPLVGQRFTASTGTWSQAPPPTAFAYQWRRCAVDVTACVNIDGATLNAYTMTSADVSHVLVASVTASNADGSAKAVSLPTGIVNSASGPTLQATPTLTGSVIVGHQLSVSTGVWAPAVSAYAIQWQRCLDFGASSIASGLTETRIESAIGCQNVKGSTSGTYNVTAADLVHRIRAVVTATMASGDATSAISNTSGVARVPKAKLPKKKK
jgi:hypothetical protein